MPSAPRRSARPRRRDQSRLLVAGILLITLGVLLVAGLRFLPGSPLAASASPKWTKPSESGATAPPVAPTPAPTPTPEPDPLPVRPAKVRVGAEGWVAWAMLDQRTGEISGSKNMASTSTTASLIKAWIAADYLRRAATAEVTPSASRMGQVRIMIRDSDNAAASALWEVVGGSASTRRLIDICDLSDSVAHSNWSNTRLSPRDIARMGACIADGRAAGPKWTAYLLKEMRLVRGVGDFGIRKAFPATLARTIAIKNGWVTRDALGEWHVNCLAVGDGWTMGVMTQYPASLGFEHGAAVCKSVASQLRAD